MVGIIIKNCDQRYSAVQNFLQQKGYKIYNDFNYKNVSFIVLPFEGVLEQGKVIVNDKTIILDDSFFGKLNKNIIIFSGVKNLYVQNMCDKYNLKYYPIMGYKEIAIKNAHATTEGVLNYIISNTKTTIFGSKVLVCGYGVCGSDLYKKLYALGADVIALTKNEQKILKQEVCNFKQITIDTVNFNDYNIIINTVPQEIITKKVLNSINKDIMIIDIASSPYGFNLKYAKEINLNAEHLEGIPSKVAPISAGNILGEFIFKVLEKGVNLC
jgi:dipicolinate synthase subunit A